MEDILSEALQAGRIVRVTRRIAAQRRIDVGQAWSRSETTLRIRELKRRRYVDLPLDDVTDVQIIGTYLKDYGS